MKARDIGLRLRGYLRRVALLFVILATLIDTRISLWRFPYARVRERVDRMARRGPRFRDVDPMWIVRWVQRVGLIIPKGTCLVRALTAQVLLARNGVQVEVVFGARFDAARKFDAHAWVEYRGRVLLGQVPEMDKFHVLRREKVQIQSPKRDQ